jgi:hypothetical protein
MKRVGPELKMPDLKNAKVPPFLSDLYYDLHDRRLLPLVGLVLVAIVAVPFLLGGGSDVEEGLSPPPAESAPAIGANASSLTVVKAQPGLRDYRKRLGHRNPTDPFKQRFTGPTSKGGLPDQETTTSGSSEAASTTTTSTTPSTSGPVSETPPSSSGSGSGGSGGGELRLFTFAVDVKIVATHTKADGKKEKSAPEVREEVVPPAPLPSAKTQAVTYMGISPKTKKPLFLVSDDVEAIYGEPKCISGSEKCQLLEVDLQMPTTFVYGPTNTRFKINVLKVEPVLKGHFEG